MSTFSYLPVAAAQQRSTAEGPTEIRQLLLLAPSPEAFPATFQRVSVDETEHRWLLKQMQRLRGSVYLEDGAIQPQALDASGCHVTPLDERSFHFVALNRHRQVVGCSRFLAHPPTVQFEELTVAQASLARDPVLGAAVQAAVRQQIAFARERGYLYVEIGGWALHSSVRHSTEAVRMAALNFSLGVALGGAAAICTATVRHNSALILRRLGGRQLHYNGFMIPQYYDERYQCDIEVLTFDSESIPGRHAERIESLRKALDETPVICCQSDSNLSLGNLLRATAPEKVAPSRLVAA